LEADRNLLEETRLSAAERIVTHGTHAHAQKDRYEKRPRIDRLESTLPVWE